MDRIKRNDKGPAVEDVQQRLVAADCLEEGAVNGVFDDVTVAAVRAFCVKSGLPAAEEVDEKLREIMKNIYNNSVTAAEEYGCGYNLVAGANIAGFLKVADAMMQQGIF